VTEDFFQGERGVVFSITPPSWLFALSLPQFMVKEKPEWAAYTEWMATNPFERWAYLAIESHGPHNQYGPTTSAILRGVDRRLYYSKWGTDIAKNSNIEEADGYWRYCGHGIDTVKWSPAPPELVRKARTDIGVGPNDLLLGCVATNTRRKLMPLLFESAYLLRHQIGASRLKLWINTDVAIREYNLNELAECFGFRMGTDLLITSTNAKRPDEWLAMMYSACDLTTLPTAGEGFGYPVVESLACGTPCVTGTFGAQAEFLAGWRDAWLCPPFITHLITNNTLVEPIYDPQQYAARLLMAWTELRQRGTLLRTECRARGELWSWANVWPHWEKWFLLGAAELQAKLVKEAAPASVFPMDPEVEDRITADINEANRITREAENAARSDSRTDVPPTTVPVDSLGSEVGGHADEQGQRTDHDNGGGLDSRAPIRVGGEADAAGA